MDILVTRKFEQDPDTVWAVVGDAGAVAGWIPAIATSRLEGNVRFASFADDGGDAVENITEHDDVGRTYVYEYVSGPLPLEEYVSRVTVSDDADGSKVVWASTSTSGSAETDEGLKIAITQIYEDALDELRNILTSRT